MTEEEAKTKWCPFARVIAGTIETPLTQAAFNRVSVGSAQHMTLHASKCLGADCMAWRWGTSELGVTLDSVPYVSGSSAPGLDWSYDLEHRVWVQRERIAHGYCGLAGQP